MYHLPDERFELFPHALAALPAPGEHRACVGGGPTKSAIRGTRDTLPVRAPETGFRGIVLPFCFHSLRRLKSGDFARCRAVVEVEQTLVLNVEEQVKTRERSDNVAVLLIEVGERWIFAKDMHALSL